MPRNHRHFATPRTPSRTACSRSRRLIESTPESRRFYRTSSGPRQFVKLSVSTGISLTCYRGVSRFGNAVHYQYGNGSTRFENGIDTDRGDMRTLSDAKAMRKPKRLRKEILRLDLQRSCLGRISLVGLRTGLWRRFVCGRSGLPGRVQLLRLL
jgi:hypothetical protein